jgi:hypothetical protein
VEPTDRMYTVPFDESEWKTPKKPRYGASEFPRNVICLHSSLLFFARAVWLSRQVLKVLLAEAAPLSFDP